MIQANSNPPGDPVCREISAATIKIPDPIIDPTTIIVPSNNPMARTNPPSLRAALDDVAGLISALSIILHRDSQPSPFQQIYILPRPLNYIFRAQNIADDRDRIRSRLDHFGRSFSRNPPNGHDG